ncbi:putative ferric-chelate reductase 1 [Betta splendens]|uniref:Ferric-chelate reductase 1 n=1 Tax=Betta splendens TaxID=158456 RepID=A0A6P7LYE6_BETSP|nr:putative ferric-chelate reductase 1 [Betta splendens]
MYTRLIIAVLVVAAVAVNTATAQTNSTNATTTAMPNTTVVAATPSSTGLPNTAATSGSTGSTNTTTSNVTITTQSTTTTPLPVGALTTTISKNGCGTSKLCVRSPSSCDPSTGICYFISAKLQSGQNYQLELSGNTTGYIATALSTGSSVGNGDTTYICANNSGVVQFLVASYSNGTGLTTTSTSSVSSVIGSVNGNKIQCVFNATLPAGITKASSSLFQVGFLTGSYNNGTLGNATLAFQQSADLSNPASHAITFKQSLTQAVLIVMVALGLTM